METWCLPKDLDRSTYDVDKIASWEEEMAIIQKKINKEKENLPKSCIDFLKQVKEDNKHLWK